MNLNLLIGIGSAIVAIYIVIEVLNSMDDAAPIGRFVKRTVRLFKWTVVDARETWTNIRLDLREEHPGWKNKLRRILFSLSRFFLQLTILVYQGVLDSIDWLAKKMRVK